MPVARLKRILLRAVAATGVAVAMYVTTCGSKADDGSGDLAAIRIASGRVLGVSSAGVVSYKGIPYAAPPVGALRWRPPGSPAPWTQLAANDYGHTCPHRLPVRHVAPESRAATTSEDCLTLNVWTPVAHETPMPVMVWLHGGGNTTGSASDRYTDGSAFARDGVVLVSFNYRLGTLGFFAHPALAAEPGGDAGNYGLLDQIAALRFVHDDIAAFGGDPANVTIFGESAGGEDVLALASSDAARGLFRRAIAESAGEMWDEWPTLAQAREREAKLATRFGLPEHATPEQLRALSADTLTSVRDNDQLGPIVDGKFVAARPAAHFPGSVHVPLLIGTNSDDGSLLDGYAGVDELFPSLTKADVAFVRARYAEHGVTADSGVAARLFRDGYFAAPARWAARSVAAGGQPAYLYRFDYVLSALVDRRSAATHGSEIPFVFENWPVNVVSDDDRRVGSALHDCWIAFARTGAPVCAAVPTWPAFDSHDGRVMVFDAHPSFRDLGDTSVLDRLEKKLLPP